MTEPDSTQPTPNGTREQGNGQSASQGTPAPKAQPQYGQYAAKDYGAMRSQFPAGYDPYLFGKPETPEPSPEERHREQSEREARRMAANERDAQRRAEQAERMQHPGMAHPGQGAGNGQPQGYGPGQGQYGPWGPGGMPPRGYTSPGKYPRYINGIDMEDPHQNPLCGHWDAWSVISFLLALFMPVPVLPALMGWMSMRRTKTMRMKGYGLAVAAVVINVLYTIAFIIMTINGVDANTLMNDMLQEMGVGSGSGSSSVSA
ncbi:MAG: DUF4190 domain-containing protein [Bifidobacterium sp.]|nr:DUF4190 domain-containing protein [Bifidobacterium sp.]